jgi:hypothetical protein
MSIGATANTWHAVECQQERVTDFSYETPARQQDAERDARNSTDDVAEDEFESCGCEIGIEGRIDDVVRERLGDQRRLAEIKGIKQPASADLP